MDIYSIGEEKCIDGVWGRMVGKRFYTDTLNVYGTIYLSRKVDVDSVLMMYSILTKCDFPQGLYEIITDKGNLSPYKQKAIEYKRGDVVWVFDNNKWQPVFYWDKNSVSEGLVCIKSFTTDGKVTLGDFIYTSEVYNKLPIDIQ